MGFLDSIGKTISDVGQSTLQKGKGMMDVAKYNSMISDEEKKIQSLFGEIGELYFNEHSEAPDEIFSQFIQDIKSSKEKIEEYKHCLEDLKGITPCPKCGAAIPQGSSFCATCGTRINPDENIIICNNAEQDSKRV